MTQRGINVNELSGKHIVIVGYGGMGAALAAALAQEHAVISVLDRDAEAIKGAPFPGRVVDISDSETTQSGLTSLTDDVGPLWGVCVTAGVLGPPTPALSIQTDDVGSILAVNLHGTMNACFAAARILVNQRSGGRILTWSSIGAVGGVAGRGAYCASKAAVEAFSRCLALELAEYDVTVNAIRPGVVDTMMVRSDADNSGGEPPSQVPMGRIGRVEDIAHIALGLLSPRASWMTGSVVTIDGGATCSL